MPSPRFYCPPPLPSGACFELPHEAANHAHRVLRLRVNDPVQVFDGVGNALDAAIIEINGKRVMLSKLGACAGKPLQRLHIVLAQAMCGSEKMDWIVQKATELGVAEIRPVQAQRSVAKLSSERAEKRIEHWRSVTVSACEQCGRNTLPQVHAPQDFSAWLAQMRDIPDTKLILSPGSDLSLHKLPAPQGKVALLIGPEGGFSAEESQLAQLAGFISTRLGAHVLRTETAAIAGVAALQTLWGDFS